MRYLWLFSALIVTACLDTTAPKPSDPAHEVFASSLHIDVGSMSRTSQGVYYADSTVGTGAVADTTDSVYVSYTGYLKDGSTFTQGQDTVSLHPGDVIPGFAYGISGMAAGGHRVIVIPSALAYGNTSVGGGGVYIPANSTLIFDIKLLSVINAGTTP